jgi:hypothetical protein
MPVPILSKALLPKEGLLKGLDFFRMKLKDRAAVPADHVVVMGVVPCIRIEPQGLIDGAPLGVGERFTENASLTEKLEVSINRGGSDPRKASHHLMHQILRAPVSAGLKKKLQNLKPLLAPLQSLFSQVGFKPVLPHLSKASAVCRLQGFRVPVDATTGQQGFPSSCPRPLRFLSPPEPRHGLTLSGLLSPNQEASRPPPSARR